MADDLKRGDRVNLTAVVEQVRADGVIVLKIPASTTLLPSVVLTTRERLADADPPPPPLQPRPKSEPPPPSSSPPVGTAVRNANGEAGEVVAPDPTIPRVRRLAGREDALMIHWQGRGLPTWEAPEDVTADTSPEASE